MFGSYKRSVVSLAGPLLAGVTIAGLPLVAGAIQQPGHLRGHAELELANPMMQAPQARIGTWIEARAGHGVARNFARLEAELGPRTLAHIDADTGVLDTLIPAGFAVPGASRSPAIAEQFALDFVARHIDLLAPGSAAADFQLVSDTLSNGVRSVGFVQSHGGLAVVGGQLSLRFKADQLIAVRSQALPVILPGGPSSAGARVDSSSVSAQARAWLAADYTGGRLDPVRTASAIEGPMILPLVGPSGALEYREVVAVEVEVDDPIGRWQVYLDARTGAPVARRSLVHWANLQYTVWQRSPDGPRTSHPAAFVEAAIDGEPSPSSATGQLAVVNSGTSASFGTDGLYIRVANASGPVSSIATLLDPGQIFTWDAGDDTELDAQLNGYIHSQLVKDRIQSIDPKFPPLELETLVTVNIDSVCNAYADGNTINFYVSGSGCENTALVADIIYHEYGHVAHILGIIPGVGLFNGAHSEGASDYLSATIVNDSAVGRGFFLDSDAPIRELDPPDFEWRWPEHTGEVHGEGRIIGGALWDLRKALIAKYGEVEGVTKTDAIWLGGLRRAVDIPSTYLEALITNDDDGNLQNGTPDICEITEVFAAHGLYDPPGAATEVSTQTLADGSVEVSLSFGQPFAGCPSAVEPGAVVRFRPRSAPGDDPQPATTLVMTAVGTGLVRAVIPAQPGFSVTQFQVELDWGNGTTAPRPNNMGDPWYEYFNGEPTLIWCTDFDEDPATQGWTLGGGWEWGAPEGGGGDPQQAFVGEELVGTNLAWPGLYKPFTSSVLTGPSVDVGGHEVVRLQYQRWLNVEDGFWDKATLTANGVTIWANHASTNDATATIHHRDREWRFHDVELTPFVDANGQVSVGFGLLSDGGLEFGGWNVDRLCIVGHDLVPPEPGPGFCGDGIVQEYEQCDDGNTQAGDGCSGGCLWEQDPVAPGEPIDDGWEPDGRGCGCAIDEPGTGGAFALGLLGLLGWRRRRSPLARAGG